MFIFLCTGNPRSFLALSICILGSNLSQLPRPLSLVLLPHQFFNFTKDEELSICLSPLAISGTRLRGTLDLVIEERN